ncbi:MAG: lactate racemase domain-containing protein [Elainella sp.]
MNSASTPNPANVKVLDKTTKMIFHYGEGFHYESLPQGTRVIYPNASHPSISNVDAAIEDALENPLGCDPLSAQLRPGMKVTIAFDDLSLPLPPMEQPDIRELIITKVLEKLTAAGIDDIHIICAVALHRHETPAELKYQLGNKIFKAFYPSSKLYNYDAEDKEGNVFLGTTEKGEEVEVSRRAVESDLVIYVNINLVSMDGGNKSYATGLSTYRTIRHHHNHHTLMHCKSYMDPANSALSASCDRQGQIIQEHMNIFKIETTLNNDTNLALATYFTKPTWDLNWYDWGNFWLNKTLLESLPVTARRTIFQGLRAPFRLTSIYAGRTAPVHEKILDKVFDQLAVPVPGQADIGIVGIPYLSPYNVNSIMNPILAYVMTLGYSFNFYRGKPLVRKGGVLIALYPLHEDFHPVHHPSYIEFYNRVLTQTTDPKTIQDKYEEEFAYNPKYIEAYRHGYAYHGVHPFYMWYWGCYGLDYLGKVIFVRPASKRPAEIMGFSTASSIAEALEMAQDVVGDNPSISNFHYPPHILLDVF